MPLENHMVVDEIWDEHEDKPCLKCGYGIKLCDCEDIRE